MEDKQKPRKRVTAETMAAKQRDISVSEFFAKNRHLLGFDNPRKALLTAVKEAVDNSLDACEEAAIVPEIWVHIETTAQNRFKVGVQDNGPGIAKEFHQKIFGLFQRLESNQEGTGVGLAAVARILEIHGGRVWVESEPGHGATFWIAFPMTVERQPSESVTEPFDDVLVAPVTSITANTSNSGI